MSDRGPNRAYLLLGSNINPEVNLPAAVRALSEYGDILAVSQVWESPLFGALGQPAPGNCSDNFLNGAVLLVTDRSAETLCVDAIPTVERRLGRIRDPRDKNAPRTIDVDLSLFNGDVLTAGRRTIPDPDILTRAFVAVPLAELDPLYVHPTEKRKLAEIAAALAPRFSLKLRTDILLR